MQFALVTGQWRLSHRAPSLEPCGHRAGGGSGCKSSSPGSRGLSPPSNQTTSHHTRTTPHSHHTRSTVEVCLGTFSKDNAIQGARKR